jgi:hypothetical protein
MLQEFELASQAHLLFFLTKKNRRRRKTNLAFNTAANEIV